MAPAAPRLQLLTVAQATALLNVSDRTIRRWIEAKKVPYLKLPAATKSVSVELTYRDGNVSEIKSFRRSFHKAAS